MADISEQGLEKIEENKKMLEQGKNVKKIDKGEERRRKKAEEKKKKLK